MAEPVNGSSRRKEAAPVSQEAPLLPHHVWIHDRVLLPRGFGCHHRLPAHARLNPAIGAGRIPDRGMPVGLAHIPHMVPVGFVQDTRTVDAVFLSGSRVRRKHHFRIAPMNTVGALEKRQSLLGPPGAPHRRKLTSQLRR